MYGFYNSMEAIRYSVNRRPIRYGFYNVMRAIRYSVEIPTLGDWKKEILIHGTCDS